MPHLPSPFSAIPFLDQAVQRLLQSFNLPLDTLELPNYTSEVLANLDEATRVNALRQTDLVWKMACASVLVLSADPGNPKWSQETLHWLSNIHAMHQHDAEWKQWLLAWKHLDKDGQQFRKIIQAPQDTSAQPTSLEYTLIACESSTPLKDLEDRYGTIDQWKKSGTPRQLAVSPLSKKMYIANAVLQDPSKEHNEWKKAFLLFMLEPGLLLWLSKKNAAASFQSDPFERLLDTSTFQSSALREESSMFIENYHTPWIVKELENPVVFQDDNLKNMVLNMYTTHRFVFDDHKNIEAAKHVPEIVADEICLLSDTRERLPYLLQRVFAVSSYNHTTACETSVFELQKAFDRIKATHPEGNIPQDIVQFHMEWLAASGVAGFVLNPMESQDLNVLADQCAPIPTWVALRLTQQLSDSAILRFKHLIQPALFNCIATDPDLFALFQEAWGQEKPGYIRGYVVDDFIRQRALPIENIGMIIDQGGSRNIEVDAPLKIPTLADGIVSVDLHSRPLKPYELVPIMIGQERYTALKKVLILSFDMGAPIAPADLYTQYMSTMDIDRHLPALTSLAQSTTPW